MKRKKTPRRLSVLLSVVVVTVFMAFLPIGDPVGAEGPPEPVTEYAVAAGDTLWTIAAEHVGEGEDVRAMIHRIMEASGITSSTIQVGQMLRIPSDRV